MNWLRALCPSILTLLLASVPRVNAEPSRLQVSENGRFLVTPEGAPTFLLADTAWSMINGLKREAVTEYLTHRKSQGFNAVTFVFYCVGDPNQVDSGKNAYDQPVFERNGGRPDPLRPRLLPGGDPANPAEYDYWDHADFAIAEARRLDLYAIVLPCWSSAVTGAYDGRPNADLIFDADNARAYGQWLGRRYHNEPHILWMVGGDRSAQYPKAGTDYRPVFRAMAEGLREGHPGALVSFHPQKAAPQSGDWFHTDPWLGFNSIQHWPEAQLAVIARDWQASPAKPTWVFEGRYEGYYKNPYKADDWGGWQMRQQAWQTVFAGAFGHTYGHERVFCFGKDGADWRRYLDEPGAQGMTHLARFMNGLDPQMAMNRIPDQSLVAEDAGKAERLKSDRITASRAADGSQALFYAANGRSFRVRMAALSGGPLSAWWYSPRTGQWHDGRKETAKKATFAHDMTGGPGAADHEFDPPGESEDGNDWVLVLAAGRAAGAAESKPPYPASPVIERMEIDFAAHKRAAPGSDNWPTTWGDDDHLYTSWGDGGGFGGTNGKGRVSLGVARVSGEAANYTGENLWGGFAAKHPAQFEGKSYGLLSVGGVLYMWVARQPNPHLARCQLATSRDHGATWTMADWEFTFADGVTVPTFLNYGRDHAGARDGYVYSYFIFPAWGPGSSTTGNFGFDVHKPGRIGLTRVSADALMDRGKHEFFAGRDGNGAPVWSAKLEDKAPVFDDANGVGWNLSVSYNAGLKRYLLATEHGATHVGKMGLFDAAEPWGPWTTVAYEEEWGEGHFEVSTFYWNFPTKWLSPDGSRFTLVFSGKNTQDSWNTVGGRFALRKAGVTR